MNNSKKQLITQINKIEAELYAEKERISQSKHEIAAHPAPYLLSALLLIAIPLVFLLRSKKSIKGVATSVLNVGKFALVSYCKKQIASLLEKR